MSLLSLVLVGLTFLKQRVAVQSGQAVGRPNAEGGPNVEGIVFLVFLVTFLAVNSWLNRGLLSGKAAAWVTQLVLSTLAFALSLLNITSPRFNPILPIIIIAIHGFILSQWFKPETKAWFGKS